MDKETIRSVWAKFLEVQEGAYGKKKEGLDPVGKEDDDVDNDGDVDSSDKYLKNRRKAIGKAMKKDDDKEETKEGKLPPALQKAIDKKKGKKDDEEDSDEKEVDNVKEAKVECPKCKGDGCDHCDKKGYHMKEGKVPPQFLKNIKKKKGEDGDDEEETKDESTCGKKVRESQLFSADELAALEEKMKQPGDTGTPPEGMYDKESPKSKKFVKDHEAGSDKKLEDYEEMGEMDAVKAGRGGPGQSPARRGDNRNSEPMKSVAKK